MENLFGLSNKSTESIKTKSEINVKKRKAFKSKLGVSKHVSSLISGTKIPTLINVVHFPS